VRGYALCSGRGLGMRGQRKQVAEHPTTVSVWRLAWTKDGLKIQEQTIHDVQLTGSREVGVWMGSPLAMYHFSLADGHGIGEKMKLYRLSTESLRKCRAYQEQNGGVVKPRPGLRIVQ